MALIRDVSYQEIPLEPVYVHNKPLQILPNTRVKIVYVFPKFTVSKDESIDVSLKEFKTARMINVSIGEKNTRT